MKNLFKMQHNLKPDCLCGLYQTKFQYLNGGKLWADEIMHELTKKTNLGLQLVAKYKLSLGQFHNNILGWDDMWVYLVVYKPTYM
jgi:hypothetical protein